MNLYARDYSIGPNESEKNEFNLIKVKEKEGNVIGRKNLYFQYPEAIRHYNSLFPNNHIDLYDWKKTGKMKDLTKEFETLVHNENTNERDILNFINHKPAYYIICSLLLYKDFGHHDTYVFPEFQIGNGKYRADYLIVGKNSGGYEFLFVELEASNKRTTIKSGYEGQTTRAGLNQISDWKYEIETDYESIQNEFKKYSSKRLRKLPHEFMQYDSTRMHYAVISGVRDDYNEKTYLCRRSKSKDQGIDMYHYDNLIDNSRKLENRDTF